MSENSKSVVTVTIAQAAVFMRCSRRHARRVLKARHAKSPDLVLLCRPSGAPEGRIEVCAMALLRIIQGSSEEIEELASRIGYAESDIASLQVRVGRVEKNSIQQQSCRNVQNQAGPLGH